MVNRKISFIVKTDNRTTSPIGQKTTSAKTDIKELALRFADKYHPGTECVILTGSQLEPDFLTPQSDVDIVLIGSQFSNVSSDGFKDGNHKIDFTRIGCSNIMNVLVDVSYSTSPTVINMIRNGVILRDETGIGKFAKEYCKEVFKRGNRNSRNDANGLIIGLTKLKKHLLKNLDGRYIPFLAGDFIRLVSSAYLFLYNKGWYSPDGFRLVKSILIKDGGSSFLNDMIRLERDYIEKPRENRDIVLLYVDKYLNLLGRTDSSVSDGGRLILNINFRDQSPECFYGDICADILTNPYLSKYFILGHIHDCRYIFKNRYCFVFDKKLDGYDELRLMRELDGLFFERRKRIINMNIVNPAYLFDLCNDFHILEKQESLMSYINAAIIQSAKDGRHDCRKAFLTGVTICITLLRSFKISVEETRSLLEFLSKKWLCRNNVHSVETYFNNTYTKNSSLYDTIRERFVEQAAILDSGIDLNVVSKRSALIADAVANSVVKLPDLCLLSLNTLPVKKPVFWHISNILEMMLNSIGVEHRDRSYFAYVIKRLYS